MQIRDMVSNWLRLLLIVAVLLPTVGVHAAAAAGTLDRQKLDRIDAYIKEQFEAAGFPGGAYAIVDQGVIVRSEGIGYSDLATKTKATTDTVYATASVTKALTAAAVLRLAEAGIIDLDRPVVSFLPWFRYQDAEQSSNVTVRHLLTHSAGVNRFSADGAIYQDVKQNRNSREHAAKALRSVPMNSAPGEKGQYCNTCYNLLGLILEEVTNQDYETYIKQQLFQPLGMNHTDFMPSSLSNARIAKEYGYLFGFSVEVAPYWKEFGRSQAPEGGAYSTAMDLGRFLAAMLDYSPNPNYSLGPIASYHQAGVRSADRSDTMYTESGFERKEFGGTGILAKSGAGMGSSAEIVLIPSLRMGIVLLVGENDSEACGTIADGIVSILLDQPPRSAAGSPNAFQVIGVISLGMLLTSLVLVIWLAVSLARYVTGRYTIKRRWAVIVRLCLYGSLSIPIGYLLFYVRPTEAGFYGFPYDMAAALIALAIAFSLWAGYSAVILLRSYRRVSP